jgi:hypothetical protein
VTGGSYDDIPKSSPFKRLSLVYWGPLKPEVIPDWDGFLAPGGGANFFKPPPPPSKGATYLSAFFASPGILMLIFSPSFNEKSFPLSFIDVAGCWVPFTILSYFLKSSKPAIKSNESFLSGNPIPIIAFYPFSFYKTKAKNRLESKHLCTIGS